MHHCQQVTGEGRAAEVGPRRWTPPDRGGRARRRGTRRPSAAARGNGRSVAGRPCREPGPRAVESSSSPVSLSLGKRSCRRPSPVTHQHWTSRVVGAMSSGVMVTATAGDGVGRERQRRWEAADDARHSIAAQSTCQPPPRPAPQGQRSWRSAARSSRRISIEATARYSSVSSWLSCMAVPCTRGFFKPVVAPMKRNLKPSRSSWPLRSAAFLHAHWSAAGPVTSAAAALAARSLAGSGHSAHRLEVVISARLVYPGHGGRVRLAAGDQHVRHTSNYRVWPFRLTVARAANRRLSRRGQASRVRPGEWRPGSCGGA